jgi:uncharacterized membrane protein (UPF0127 family)
MRAAAPVLAALLALALPLSGCAGATAVGTTVQVGSGLAFEVEVVDTPQSRERGLSGRDSLAAGTGMLFRYDDRQVRRYWMADMRFPIDLAWISDDRVVGVETLQPCPSREDCPRHESPEPVQQVLEVPAGALAGIAPGAAVSVG